MKTFATPDAAHGETTSQNGRTPHGDRSFVKRYGARIVSRGIATFPTLVLRWQAALELDNGQVVTLAHIVSYYREKERWPSVSIAAIAEARDVHRNVVEREIAQLEAKGYIARAGTDPRYRTFYFALSGLFTRLEELVVVEERLADLNKEQARLRRLAGKGRLGSGDTKKALPSQPTEAPGPSSVESGPGILSSDVERMDTAVRRSS